MGKAKKPKDWKDDVNWKVLALFPLAVVLLGARWIDRWEPEPPLVLGIGFAPATSNLTGLAIASAVPGGNCSSDRPNTACLST